MTSETRAKTYLFRYIAQTLKNLKPSDLGLSDDFEITPCGDTKSSIQLRIKDPTTGSHYLSVKVTEHY